MMDHIVHNSINIRDNIMHYLKDRNNKFGDENEFGRLRILDEYDFKIKKEESNYDGSQTEPLSIKINRINSWDHLIYQFQHFIMIYLKFILILIKIQLNCFHHQKHFF